MALIVLSLPVWLMAQASVPAFPGAEGAGALATGGRDGDVYIVTNLNADGPGSLQNAVDGPNRIVVFAVSGIIDLSEGEPGESGKIKIEHPNITIAGQTAPGEGICLKNGALKVMESNVVIRYLRARRGYIQTGDMGDAFTAKGEELSHVIFDHLSASWATDENLTMTNLSMTTAQYCLVSEGLDYTNPNQTPQNHSFGSLFGSAVENGWVTFHHMLYAHHRLRCVRTTSADFMTIRPLLEFRNSIIYNCLELTSHTGSQGFRANWVNNYYKDGPSTQPSASELIFHFKTKINQPGKGIPKMHAHGNYVYGNAAKTAHNWQAMTYDRGNTEDSSRVETEFQIPDGEIPITTQPAEEAYSLVLADAGANIPSRDPVDLRIVNDVINGTGEVIGKETNLPEGHRWPDYQSLPAPQDADGDGLPDYWEVQFALNKNDPADNVTDPDDDIYENIEEYFNNTDPHNAGNQIVYVSVSDSRAHEEDGEQGEFLFHRSGDASNALTAQYSISGSAQNAADYANLSGAVNFAAGENVKAVSVSPVSDAITEDNEQVIVTVDTGMVDYMVGCPSAALVVLRDESWTGISRSNQPHDYQLLQVYPNPFNAETRIEFRLEKSQYATLKIFDLGGRVVRTLFAGTLHADNYSIRWHGNDENGNALPSGVYYCRLQAAGKISTQQVTLLK